MGLCSAAAPGIVAGVWLAVIPLFLIPACWAMLLASDLHPGIAIGRGAAWLLVGGCVLAALQVTRRPATVARPEAGVWSPALIAALVLAWQVVTYLWHAPVLMPGAPWILERAGAAVCAWGLASWLAGRDLEAAVRGLCGAGAVVLIIAALSDLFAPLTGVLGAEAPFGLSNFNVAAGMPLLGLGLAVLLRRRRPSPITAGLVALGGLSLVIVALRLSHDGLGYHLHLHEGVRGAMVEALAMGGLAVLFMLPRDVHLPGVVLAALLLVGGEAYVVSGRVDTTAFAPSTLQRVFLWRSGYEAVLRAPVMGYGPGAAVAVLNQQPSFPAAWLSVPSYPEHVHQELLEALLDGGLVNLALLGWLGWATLAPLWRRRERPIAQALLVGWAGFLSHAMLEVGLSQPGPVLMLSLLAGVSWAVGAAEPQPQSMPASASAPDPVLAALRQLVAAVAGLLVAVALGVFLLGEMRGHLGRLAVGSVSELQMRAASVCQRAAQDGNAVAQVKAIVELRSLVGPLDVLDYQQAGLLQQISAGQLHQAVSLAIAQADRLPVLAVNLTLLVHLHQDCHRQNDAWDAEQIELALDRARARLPLVMAQVRANDKNGMAYLHLNLFLHGHPPHQAPPAP